MKLRLCCEQVTKEDDEDANDDSKKSVRCIFCVKNG